jgi:hypothetical protein
VFDDDRLISWAKCCKEFWQRQAGPHMPPIAMVLRNGSIQVIAFAPVVDRDAGLKALSVLGPAFGADTLVFIAETFGKTLEKGATPLPGELQLHWQVGDRAGLCEDISCLIVGRSGPVRFLSLPYQYDGREFQWDKPRWAQKVDGLIPNTMRLILRERMEDNPEIAAMIADGKLNAAQARLLLAMTSLAALKKQGYHVETAELSAEACPS